jgi:putative hemolysin
VAADQRGLSHRCAEISATALVVTLITFITIFLVNWCPSALDSCTRSGGALVARPMTWLASGCQTVCPLLSMCTHGMLKLLRIDATDACRMVTEEEIGQPGGGGGRRHH